MFRSILLIVLIFKLSNIALKYFLLKEYNNIESFYRKVNGATLFLFSQRLNIKLPSALELCNKRGRQMTDTFGRQHFPFEFVNMFKRKF